MLRELSMSQMIEEYVASQGSIIRTYVTLVPMIISLTKSACILCVPSTILYPGLNSASPPIITIKGFQVNDIRSWPLTVTPLSLFLDTEYIVPIERI